MQTMYNKAFQCIQRSGAVIDLGEYRRRQALARKDNLAWQPEEEPWTQEESTFRPVVLPGARGERPGRRERRAWVLDVCASLSVIVMTVLFALRVML